MAACGGTFFVTAIIGDPDWSRPALNDGEWDELFANLDRVETICRSHGLTQVLHPHVNTMIETAEEFERFLDRSSVTFCFDTGHMTIGGADVVEVAAKQFDRIGIVHLKDVDGEVMRRERARELTLMEATRDGIFPAIGDGMVRIAEVVATLESQGYDGWYVMETDVALTDGEPPAGEGPVRGVARSLAYLRTLDSGVVHR
jgi:inosose dehydratase